MTLHKGDMVLCTECTGHKGCVVRLLRALTPQETRESFEGSFLTVKQEEATYEHQTSKR